MIDIIGNVFSSERPHYRDFNLTDTRDNLFVLTILTQKFRYVLNSEYQDAFSRYLNLTSINSRYRLQSHKNQSNEIECDVEKYKKGSNYRHMEMAFIRTCKHKLMEYCNNLTSPNDNDKLFCDSLLRHEHVDVNDGDESEKRSNRNQVHLNDFTFNKQLVFSEYFNLFDFITTLLKDDVNSAELNHKGTD